MSKKVAKKKINIEVFLNACKAYANIIKNDTQYQIRMLGVEQATIDVLKNRANKQLTSIWIVYTDAHTKHISKPKLRFINIEPLLFSQIQPYLVSIPIDSFPTTIN